jgi:hypothetical protein
MRPIFFFSYTPTYEDQKLCKSCEMGKTRRKFYTFLAQKLLQWYVNKCTCLNLHTSDYSGSDKMRFLQSRKTRFYYFHSQRQKLLL